jgi:hypothetical protein
VKRDVTTVAKGRASAGILCVLPERRRPGLLEAQNLNTTPQE